MGAEDTDSTPSTQLGLSHFLLSMWFSVIESRLVSQLTGILKFKNFTAFREKVICTDIFKDQEGTLRIL